MRLAWITGAGGLIGNYLVNSAPPGWNVKALHSADLEGWIEKDFEQSRPDLILHCAAISKNPICDANPELARRVNTELTGRLSDIARDIDFVFTSTDLIFDGKKGSYVETDTPKPLSIYAETKVRAEDAVLKNPRHTIVRLSLNAGHSPSGNRGFNEEMRIAFVAGKTLNLFEDEFRCPTPAEVTARAIWEIAGKPGIFHFCGAERLSRYEIGQLIASNHPELNPKIARSSLRDYKGSPRSPDTSMDCSKIQKLLSFPLPRFSDWARAQPLGSL